MENLHTLHEMKNTKFQSLTADSDTKVLFLAVEGSRVSCNEPVTDAGVGTRNPLKQFLLNAVTHSVSVAPQQLLTVSNC